MRVKLDENLGQRGRRLLVEAGHDVSTLTGALEKSPIAGKLWIIERHRIREYMPDDRSED